MNNDKGKKDQSNSLVSSLVVPILVALITGGTAPWWINLFRDSEGASEPVPGTQIEEDHASQALGEFSVSAISGLSYHKAREILTQEGWIPLTQRHFYPQEEPSLQYGTGKIFWDLGYWEIVSCSGTAEGFCRFEFSDPNGRRLVVVTTGIEDPGISAQAMVSRVSLDEENSP